MSASNRLIVSILAIAALAIAFWMLALGPKREEADELAGQVEQLQASLTEAQGKVTEALAAKREFPSDYRQLVVLGQAVPGGDETSSLLVELDRVATTSKIEFSSIQLSDSGTSSTPAPAPAPATPAPTPAGGATGAVPASATVPPTEAAASLLPLGASIGTAGLGVMPYSLSFSGSFFEIADFIKRIDALVDTSGAEVAVDGRLVTIDSFSLTAASDGGFQNLSASFSVTTYLTPPSQGATAGATPTAPAPTAAVPATETAPAEPPASEESTPVSNEGEAQ